MFWQIWQGKQKSMLSFHSSHRIAESILNHSLVFIEIHFVQYITQFFQFFLGHGNTFGHGLIIRIPRAEVEFRCPIIPADVRQFFAPAVFIFRQSAANVFDIEI